MHFLKKNRSAFVNFIKAHYGRQTRQSEVDSYPYYLSIDPSSICQLQCPLCPTGIENYGRTSGDQISFRTRSLLSEELFDSLIDELGEYLFMIFFYNWGEPLINKNLPGFIKKAKSLDIYTEIHTNLSLHLSDGYLEEILASGIDEIAVSIDGFTQEAYETYRRGGKIDLVKKNINRLAELRTRLGLKTKIIWNYLVFSFNEKQIDATKSYCREREIIFNQREAFIDPEGHADWFPSYRQQELAVRSPEKGDQAARETPPPDKRKTCAWHYFYSVVNADGSISPCCAPWEQEVDFGQVTPGVNSFFSVWNNDLFKMGRGADLAAAADRRVICATCPYAGVTDLYTWLDQYVRERFWEIFRGSDPIIEKAFTLLDDGRPFTDFVSKNYAHLEQPQPLKSIDLISKIKRYFR